ncbi:hypothetical protein MBOU_56810 [Mycobacterium bourgelatii]|uniref:Uncharacterized protein n=1 Tax=Mycobacterium bourgelatii TaxID=1273442 RepID=A0A7I9YY20_MYCBU|nr:hypothetical protein MBOU_56810 [Mycobacterium bourgelatii]
MTSPPADVSWTVRIRSVPRRVARVRRCFTLAGLGFASLAGGLAGLMSGLFSGLVSGLVSGWVSG